MKKSLTVFYANPPGFSGQRLATEIVIQGLNQKGWKVLEVHTPALNRVKKIDGDRDFFPFHVLTLISRLLIAWQKGITAVFSKNIIYVNLGQTKFAIIRDGFPLLLRSLISSEEKAVVSLHGSYFLEWKENYLETKLFQNISKATKYITVLGPNHKNKLMNLGISEEKIVILDNTCLLAPLSESEVLSKHQINNTQTVESKKKINILFLSSLIEAKGYVEFIEAISQLALDSNVSIEATLCGKITTIASSNDRFSNPAAAKEWIETQVAKINKSNYVRLLWINGAIGEDKAKLFRQAQIFVLPSRYKTEAQPISILEALASGCAVITTKVGEISTTVSEKTAFLIDDCSSATIARAIRELHNNPDKREQLALNGNQLFQERFSYQKHIEQWEKLLENFYN